MRKIINVLFLALISISMHAQIKEFDIVSKMDGQFETDAGITMPFWGFGFGGIALGRATMPGPLLEVELGDSVIIHFSNSSPEDHTIHLHGLDVSQVYDGVPATSVSVPNNGSYDYHWKANHVGSFLYHCHVQTIMHSSLGMYGMIVVKNKPDTNLLYSGGPGFNKERNFLSSELFTDWNLNPISPGPFHLFDPDYFMINGKASSQILLDSNCVVSAEIGDSVLLRFANIAFSKVVYNFPPGLNPVVYTSDGRILPTPMNIDSLEVFAGERYQVLLKPTQFVDDFITVTYKRMYEDEIEGVNLIAVNSYASSVEEYSVSDKYNVEIFPNPSNGKLTIKSDFNFMEMPVKMYNSVGQVIASWNQKGNAIDLSKYESGIYFVEFRFKGEVILKRVIIE